MTRWIQNASDPGRVPHEAQRPCPRDLVVPGEQLRIGPDFREIWSCCVKEMHRRHTDHCNPHRFQFLPRNASAGASHRPPSIIQHFHQCAGQGPGNVQRSLSIRWIKPRIISPAEMQRRSRFAGACVQRMNTDKETSAVAAPLVQRQSIELSLRRGRIELTRYFLRHEAWRGPLPFGNHPRGADRGASGYRVDGAAPGNTASPAMDRRSRKSATHPARQAAELLRNQIATWDSGTGSLRPSTRRCGARSCACAGRRM